MEEGEGRWESPEKHIFALDCQGSTLYSLTVLPPPTSILEAENTAYAFWGWPIIGLVKSNVEFPDIKIIVPDTRINDAERALRDRAFPLCTNPHCRELLANRDPVDTSHFHEVLAWNKRHLVAQSHFHLQPERSRIIVSLHKQSDVLPWMPELTVSPPPPNHPHLVLSNDASRLPRAWPSPQAVQTLNPDSFCEGLLRLFCRDYGMPDKPHLLWWRMMINAIGDFDDPVRILPARFQLAWDHLMERRDEEVNVLLEVLRLRKRFIDDGELTGDSLPVVDLAEFEKPV